MTDDAPPEPDDGGKPVTPATPKRGAFPARPADLERAKPYIPEPPEPDVPAEPEPDAGRPAREE